MIHPNTQIQYIDLKDGEPRYKTIDELYNEYAHRITYCNEYSYITFSNRPVKITELTGWTDLIEVRKISRKDFKWQSFKCRDNELITSDDEIIPIYDIDKTYIGFHGEVKYLYRPKLLSSIEDHEFIRTHNYENIDGKLIEFDKPKDRIIINETNPTYGYQLITKSGFFNGNKIHLFACEYDSRHKDENINLYK